MDVSTWLHRTEFHDISWTCDEQEGFGCDGQSTTFILGTFNLPRFDFAEPKDRRSLDNALEAESCSLHLRLLRLGRVTSISLGHNEKSMTWTGNSTEIVVNSRLLPASPKEKAGCCRRCVEKGEHFLAGENIHRGKEVIFFNFPIQSLALGKRICPCLAGKGKSKGGRDGV